MAMSAGLTIGKESCGFVIGNYVQCGYEGGGQVEGYIQALNHDAGLLFIKAAASDGNPKHNDVHVINTSCIERFKVRREIPPEPVVFKEIDIRKLKKIRSKAVQAKTEKLRQLAANAPHQGRVLFLQINKAFKEVEWKEDKILVMGEVTISPPYGIENVSGDREALVTHVKKIVQKLLTGPPLRVKFL